jgi:hypothetical protein
MQSPATLRLLTISHALFLFLAFLLAGASGCATSSHSSRVETNPDAAFANHYGYALLADLVGDEKDLSKLRFIKHERPELKALLQEIAGTNRVAYERLQKFAKTGPALNLKDQGLPTAEIAARKAISKSKEKAILSSKGKELEIQVLLDQEEALTYGSHLAGVIAPTESDLQRRQFLEQLAADLGKLQQRVLTMLSSNYSLPR